MVSGHPRKDPGNWTSRQGTAREPKQGQTGYFEIWTEAGESEVYKGGGAR